MKSSTGPGSITPWGLGGGDAGGYALLWEAPQRKYVLIDYLGDRRPPERRPGGRAPLAAAGEVSVLGWNHRGVRGPGRGPVMAYASGA